MFPYAYDVVMSYVIKYLQVMVEVFLNLKYKSLVANKIVDRYI